MSLQQVLRRLTALVLTCGILTGCGKKAAPANNTPAGPAGSEVPAAARRSGPPAAPALPELDERRIAADERRGIRFSADKRTLLKYDRNLPDTGYAIPEGVTAIGRAAFKDCNNLTGIRIPASVENIGEEAFMGCGDVEELTIPAGVKSIGDGAFSYCLKVTVSPDNARYFTDEAGALIDREGKRLLYLPRNFNGEYTVPGGVKSIGASAFEKIIYLTAVNLHDGVTEIGESAFFWCVGLTELNIPAGVTRIGESAFVKCRKVAVSPDNARYFTDEAGALIDRKERKLLYFPPDFQGEYAVSAEVTEIGGSAFLCCELAGVRLPPSVTAIGESAFDGCENLTKAMIPYGVAIIGVEAFQDCGKLTDVMLPPTVTAIGKNAFKGCGELKRMTIPVSVKSIGESAFAGCPCEASVKQQFPNYR